MGRGEKKTLFMEQCRLTTLFIDRPEHGGEVLSMNVVGWLKNKGLVLYPDSCCEIGKSGSDFPYSGITVCCKWQGHFVFGNGHREKWVLADVSQSSINLEFFGPEWSGCIAYLYRQ
jgi:hypothetical protein